MSWKIDNNPIRLSFTGEEQWLGLCENFNECGAYLVRQKNLWNRKFKRPVCHECRLERMKIAQRKRWLRNKGGKAYVKLQCLRLKNMNKKRKSPTEIKYNKEYKEIVDMKKRGILSDKEHAYELDLLQRKFKLSTPQVA